MAVPKMGTAIGVVVCILCCTPGPPGRSHPIKSTRGGRHLMETSMTIAQAAIPAPPVPHAPVPDAATVQLEQQLMRKVSRHLLGFLFLLFVFSFLDRINIGFAGLTMMQDLGLSGTQFGFATTLFYIAYIACSIPSNIVLARIGARRWIGAMMIAWGMASTATLFASGPASLYALRFLVGVTEAGFLPGMLLYLTYWFPSAYRARANALFMIAMPVTAAIGSALSGLILGLDGHWGLQGWQWLFLLEGMPSVLLGLAPVAPQQKTSVLAEMLSPTVLKFGIAYFCLVNTLAMVAVWTPLIVKSFNSGASNTQIGLLAAIPQVCTVLGMIAWGRRSDRLQERRWHIVWPMLLSAAGWLLTAYAGHPVLQLLGVCMASTGAYTAMSVFWTTPDRALSLGARAIGIAVINATGNIGSALNPVVVGWLKDLTHSFATGLLYASVLLVAGAAIVLTLPIARGSK
eukprot:gene24413-29280_t